MRKKQAFMIIITLIRGTERKGARIQPHYVISSDPSLPVLDIWELLTVRILDNLGGNEENKRSPWYKRMKRTAYAQGRIKESHFGMYP